MIWIIYMHLYLDQLWRLWQVIHRDLKPENVLIVRRIAYLDGFQWMHCGARPSKSQRLAIGWGSFLGPEPLCAEMSGAKKRSFFDIGITWNDMSKHIEIWELFEILQIAPSYLEYPSTWNIVHDAGV